MDLTTLRSFGMPTLRTIPALPSAVLSEPGMTSDKIYSSAGCFV